MGLISRVSSRTYRKRAIMELGYWNIRGLAEPIRYLLKYAEIEYTERLFQLKPEEDGGETYNFTTSYQKSDWGVLKPTQPHDFPNVPYLTDGEQHITQHQAIMAYISRKHNILMPQSAEEHWRVDMINGVKWDWMTKFGLMCYGFDGQGENALQLYTDNELPIWRKKMDDYFGKHKYCAGETLTYADLGMFEMMDMHQEIVAKDCFKDEANILAFMERIGNISQIKAYRETDEFKQMTCMNPSAKFNSRPVGNSKK